MIGPTAGEERVIARRSAAFLDRDGVLNVDRGFVHRIEDFEWIGGAPQAVKLANDNGFLAIVVTNQSGVARGLYSEAEVLALHGWMNRSLGECGARIDGFYHCPYHPDGAVAAYRRDSDLRKPQPGMILQAIAEWSIDASSSFLIGDSERDMLAAERAGVRGWRFDGGDLVALMVEAIRAAQEVPSD